MIEPTYQRAQLWQPRSRLRTPLLAAMIGAACFAAVAYTVIGRPTLALSRVQRTMLRMQVATDGRLAAWRVTHPGKRCPARLGELMAVPLDGWGRAFEYSCTPRRLTPYVHLQLRSAGPDGSFDTDDDLWSDR